MVDIKSKVYSTNFVHLKNILDNCTYMVDIQARNTMAELSSSFVTGIKFTTLLARKLVPYHLCVYTLIMVATMMTSHYTFD